MLWPRLRSLSAMCPPLTCPPLVRLVLLALAAPPVLVRHLSALCPPCVRHLSALCCWLWPRLQSLSATCPPCARIVSATCPPCVVGFGRASSPCPPLVRLVPALRPSSPCMPLVRQVSAYMCLDVVHRWTVLCPPSCPLCIPRCLPLSRSISPNSIFPKQSTLRFSLRRRLAAIHVCAIVRHFAAPLNLVRLLCLPHVCPAMCPLFVCHVLAPCQLRSTMCPRL